MAPPDATPRKLVTPARLALAAILLGALAVRLYGLKHGLPYVHHSDEWDHFTSVAVGMFGGDYNPHYFQNPSAFTYLVHIALRFQFGDEIFDEYAMDPTEIYVTGRLVAVALSLLGVAAVYMAGRRLWGAMEGLAAAAVLAFAFLVVAYSRFALTDVGVLAPVALALYGIVMIREDGALRYFVIAGLGLGLTVSFKYTAGLVLVPLLAAVVLRARRERAPLPEAVIGGLFVGGVGLAAFLATNPYFLLDLGDAVDQLRTQYDSAGKTKVGQASEDPYGFYPSTLTWALGWGALIAAAAGFVSELRRDRVRALLLAAFPLLLFLYLASDAERYFARWLLPAYPVLALFAGVALARAARAIARKPALQLAALGVLAAVVVAQPLIASVRTGAVLRNDDTREIARRFMLEELPAGTKVVIEPALRRAYDLPTLGIRPRPGEPHLVRRFGPPVAGVGGRPSPARNVRFVLDLEPGRIDSYRSAGHCVVVTGGWLRQRAKVARLEPALAYYDRLARESKVLFRVDPYTDGADEHDFDFDRSTHIYHPAADFERPGPEVVVYRLDDCSDGRVSSPPQPSYEDWFPPIRGLTQTG